MSGIDRVHRRCHCPPCPDHSRSERGENQAYGSPAGIINNELSILNVSIELQLVAKGIIIMLALALDRYLQFEK